MKQIILSFAAGLLFVTGHPLSAQIGNNNPTGPAGTFNGNITTGCSYDPFTGNATRAITDMVVAGGVGAYPLAFSRTANSRYQIGQAYEFGDAGFWRHSYTWGIDGSQTWTSPNQAPTYYEVFFPDGRIETFTYSSSDIYFRASSGIRERFQPLDLISKLAYLIMPDGGKIEFKATVATERVIGDGGPAPIYDSPVGPSPDGGPTPAPGTSTTYYSYRYQAQAIIDPYGIRTNLSYNPDGSLNVIQELAGRWIQLVYKSAPPNSNGVSDIVIDYIHASDGRKVQYNYGLGSYPPGTATYTRLDSVVYYPDPSVASPPVAYYAYQAPNVDGGSNYNGFPLLASCDDPMYAGPMKKISYSYATSNGDPMIHVSAGQILSENSGTTGQIVSRLYIPYVTWRNEIRGDGPSRQFVYGGTRLESATDFKNQIVRQGYDDNSYVNLVIDRNQHSTNITNDQFTGNPTQVVYPLTPPDTTRGSVQYTYGNQSCPDPNNRDWLNPYYLFSVTNEQHYSTVYWRDSNKRVREVDYPDGGLETFTYNGFGQVLTHRMSSGGTESFEYDADGRATAYRDAYHQSGNPSFWYQFDGLDRLRKVTDTRGADRYDLNYTTEYQYNLRGQMTKKTHPIDPTTAQRYFVQNEYNPDGTLHSVTDEQNHTTTYGYDDYKRVTSIGTPRNETTTFNYAQDWVNPYVHTTSAVKGITSPLQKQIHFAYDENWRRRIRRDAPGTADDAWSFFDYDPAGNFNWMQDARGNVTTFGYDERNRRRSANQPLNQTTSWTYDLAGNKKSELRPDGGVTSYDEYDPMNRLKQSTVTRDGDPAHNVLTQWQYDQAGNMRAMIDPRTKTYSYGFDLMNRKTSVTYPPDWGGATRSEIFTYYDEGNLWTFTNRAGNVQTFQYDNRNREKYFSWNDGQTAPRTISYYPTGTVRNVHAGGGPNNPGDADDFTYDENNRLLSDAQTSAGMLWVRTVTYTYDADGNRQTLNYPAGYSHTYNYTNRNQLDNINDTGYGGAALVKYHYDANGNSTDRLLRNGARTDYAPADPLNRIAALQHTLAGGMTQRFDYDFDAGNRLKYEVRNGMGYDTDGFGYDQLGEVTGFHRAGSLQGDGTVAGGANVATLSYDANGNRDTVVNNGAANIYTPDDLNQYTSDNTGGMSYDANGNLASYNGWTYGYDAQNRLNEVHQPATGTDVYYYFDGLNRQILRYVNGQWIYSTWDGWNLIEERDVTATLLNVYTQGAGGEMVVRSGFGGAPNLWFQKDGRGNTSHVSDDFGNLKERYTYDLEGNPFFFNATGGQLGESAFSNRFLFAGADYLKESGLYDMRNRFYHPRLNRFLQPDPIGFAGDPSNIYRYCAGDPVNRSDPSGLASSQEKLVPVFYKPNEPKSNWSANYSDRNGWTQTWGWNGTTIGPGGLTDRIFAAPLGPLIGPWGEHPAGPRDFGPNDHGSGGGLGDGGGGGGGGGGAGSGLGSPRYSGSFTVPWWPSSLTLPYTTPATPEQAAWTERGKWPTLIIGGIIFLPAGLEFIAPEGAIALSQSLRALPYAARLNSARVLVGTQAVVMGVTSAAYRPINEEVLQLLEEEIVPWEFWRP